MKYDIQRRVFLVKKYYELSKIVSIQRAFRAEYPKKGTPTHYTMENIVSYFEKYGSVLHVASIQKKSKQKRERAKKELKKLVSDFLNLSRKAAVAVGVSPTLV
jgi:hypothetical protein